MRPAIKIALIFAAVWIVIKMSFYVFGIFQDDIVATGLINNLFLLVGISLDLYLEKKKEGYGVGTAFSDLRKAVTTGMIYSVIVAGFIYLYYSEIHPEFTENRIEKRMDLLYSEMERPSYVDSLRTQNENFSVLTEDEIASKIKAQTVGNLSPKSSFVFALLGLMILTFTYAIFITLIYQKILFRDYYSGK